MGDSAEARDDAATFNERQSLAIRMACDAFEEAGLSVVESFRAAYVIAASAAAMEGYGMDELAEMLGLRKPAR